MTVPVRYILAAIAFGVAALGFFLLPADAYECGASGCHNPPPSCCSPPPPPPCCRQPPIVVPPPHIAPPNIVVVNAGARAVAQSSAIAIAVANANTGDTIIHQNVVVDSGAAAVSASSSALTITEGAPSIEGVARDRDLPIQAICMDTSGNPHPASQTFGERSVREDYAGEIYRCISGTRMRYTLDGRSTDCAQGEALWYEHGALECRRQIPRRNCNERSLLRRFGPGDKIAHFRDAQSRQTQSETTFNGAMLMDGGVGQGVW